MTAAAPGPWLPESALPKRLNDDLRARGWGVFHHRDRTVTLTAPDGQHLVCTDLRAAYATAREYTNTQTWNEATDPATELAQLRAQVREFLLAEALCGAAQEDAFWLIGEDDEHRTAGEHVSAAIERVMAARRALEGDGCEDCAAQMAEHAFCHTCGRYFPELGEANA